MVIICILVMNKQSCSQASPTAEPRNEAWTTPCVVRTQPHSQGSTQFWSLNFGTLGRAWEWVVLNSKRAVKQNPEQKQKATRQNPEQNPSCFVYKLFSMPPLLTSCYHCHSNEHQQLRGTSCTTRFIDHLILITICQVGCLNAKCFRILASEASMGSRLFRT